MLGKSSLLGLLRRLVPPKIGAMLTLVLVVKRALLNDYLEAHQCALKEAGCGDTWSVCGVAPMLVSVLNTWEGQEHRGN